MSKYVVGKLLHSSLPSSGSSPWYLAQAVDDDEGSPKEIAARWVLSHDVFIPQLDGHQSPEELAELFNHQVDLPLDKGRGDVKQKTQEEYLEINSP